MRIATHAAHSGFEYELAKTGHEFFSVGGWDDYRRPKPENWHLVERPEGEFDVALVLAGDGFDKLRSLDAPVVSCVLGDDGEGDIPAVVEDRVHSVVFLGREVAARWRMKDDSKKRVIELGVDENVFGGHQGDIPEALTVGWAVPKRWEKGLTQLNAIAGRVGLKLVGTGNDGLPYAVGPLPFESLLEAYRRHRVYLNPGPVIGISVAEAMMTGMPVVAFRPINLCNLIMDGVNGFVVDTVHGAVMRIRELCEDPALARRIGDAARATAVGRFGLPLFLSRWNRLLEEAAVSRRVPMADHWKEKLPKPWSDGYFDRRREFLLSVFADPGMMGRFKEGSALPERYGPMLDERVVEYPWVLARLESGDGELLDAGSTLNHAFILDHPLLRKRKITVFTLETDFRFPESRISYIMGDFRERMLPEGKFDGLVCISTLEHVGMDQTFRHSIQNPYPGADRDAWRKALLELRRLLRPGGQFLVTVPFGRYEDHGWLQQFDRGMVESLKGTFSGEIRSEAYYRYVDDGWRPAKPEECAECSYFNIHAAKGYDQDDAAAARAVACLELVAPKTP